MSNKNISQSITEAWAKSVAIGMDQSHRNEQKRQQLEETSATLHNKAVQHILENDKGFYRPDTDPFFRKVDGDLLRRQRLAEQTPVIGAAVGASQAVKAKEEEEEKRVNSEMEAIRKRQQEEIARRDAQAQTGINPESERYRGRENEAALRGDPDFDPTAPGAAGEVRASQVKDSLGKVGRVFRDGRRLPAGYAGRGVNYGGAVAVGQMAPRELSPEERERQRAEQEANMKSGALKNLEGLDDERRKELEASLAPDADLETLTTAINRARRQQDTAAELAGAGYKAGREYDPKTGRLTQAGREIRAGRQQEAQDKRDAVRARFKARADQRKAENLARKQQRTQRANRRRADLGMKQLGMPTAAEYGLGSLGAGSEKITAATIGSGRPAAPSRPARTSQDTMTASDAQAEFGDEAANLPRDVNNPGRTGISANASQGYLDQLRNYLNNLKLIRQARGGNPEGRAPGGSGAQTGDPNLGQQQAGQGLGTETTPGMMGIGLPTGKPGRRRPDGSPLPMQ